MTSIQSMNQLISFLEKHSKVQCFSTGLSSLWNKQNGFLESNIQLDWFEVCFHSDDLPILKMVSTLFNQLFERKFYKRLSLNMEHLEMYGVPTLYDDVVLHTIKGLEKLRVDAFNQNPHYSSHLFNVKELKISYCNSYSDAEIIAKNLVNLKHLNFGVATYEKILPFIQQSTKLCTIKFMQWPYVDDFRLVTLNKEREKLSGAHKVTIYILEPGFLKTKWTTQHGDTNLKMIELKRSIHAN